MFNKNVIIRNVWILTSAQPTNTTAMHLLNVLTLPMVMNVNVEQALKVTGPLNHRVLKSNPVQLGLLESGQRAPSIAIAVYGEGKIS